MFKILIKQYSISKLKIILCLSAVIMNITMQRILQEVCNNNSNETLSKMSKDVMCIYDHYRHTMSFNNDLCKPKEKGRNIKVGLLGSNTM
jgi:hypothetical protein